MCLICPANTWSRVQTQQMAFVMIIRSSLVSLPQNRRTSLFLCHDGCGLALSLSFVYCVTLSVQRPLTSVSTFLALVILAGTAFLGNHTRLYGHHQPVGAGPVHTIVSCPALRHQLRGRVREWGDPSQGLEWRLPK